MRLVNTVETIGRFWLSSQANESPKIPGTLKITTTGHAQIELLGTLGDHGVDVWGPDLLRLNGTLETGTKVTLDQCFHTSQSIGIDGVGKSKIRVGLVVTGAHFMNDERVEFERVRFTFKGMDEWFGAHAIDVTHAKDRIGGTISFERPKDVKVQLDDRTEFGIVCILSLSQYPPGRSASVSQETFCELAFSAPRDVEEIRPLIYKVMTFFSLALDRVVSMSDLVAYSSKVTSSFGGSKARPLPMSVYYESLPQTFKDNQSSNMGALFEYETISGDLDVAIKAWMDAYETISPSLNLYFAAVSGAHEFIDGEFLSLVQAVETLHRRDSDEREMPNGEFKKLLKEVADACPSEKRSWIKSKLAYANELSLHQRLERMIEPFSDLLGDEEARYRYVRGVVNTRNWLTHYDKRLEGKAYTSGELIGASWKLEFIIQLHLLQRIGFSDEKIRQVVKENKNTSYKVRQDI